MRKILLSTTALVALSWTSAAMAANVQLSGNVKIDIETWADGQPNENGENDNRMQSDLELWVKSEHFTDDGIKVAPEVRIKPGTGLQPETTPRIVVSNRHGTLTVGEEHSIAHTLSLGAELRGTISGANRVALTDLEIAPINRVSNIAIAERAQAKIAYLTPNWRGVQLGYSTTDPGGGGSKANTIAYGASFDAPRIYGVDVAVAFAATRRQNKIDNREYKDESNKEYGIAFKYGQIRGSLVQLDWQGGDRMTPTERAALTGTRQPGDSDLLTGDQQARELEVIYDLRPHLQMNAVWFRSKASSGDYANDTFESKGFGIKYDLYRGLKASFAFNAFDYQDVPTPSYIGGAYSISGESRNDKQGYGYRIRLQADF